MARTASQPDTFQTRVKRHLFRRAQMRGGERVGNGARSRLNRPTRTLTETGPCEDRRGLRTLLTLPGLNFSIDRRGRHLQLLGGSIHAPIAGRDRRFNGFFLGNPQGLNRGITL